MADEMERSRAARALLIDVRKHDYPEQQQVELDAFMAIFHPGRERIVLDGCTCPAGRACTGECGTAK